ncbi:MAG: D-sedoheptulose-7-phosphate isomerase [Acetobacteraceae bacterium]
MDEAARFKAIFAHSAELTRRAAADLSGAVIAAVDLCEASLRSGGKLIICGNGGAAAQAQHLATEFLVRLRPDRERPSYPALALTLDGVTLTAGGNDYGFERIFERPLRGLGRRGDVLVAISTSGRSANVLAALAAANEMGIATVGLLGADGGPAASLCSLVLLVPDRETARIQECHLTLGHALLELLEDRLMARPIA